MKNQFLRNIFLMSLVAAFLAGCAILPAKWKEAPSPPPPEKPSVKGGENLPPGLSEHYPAKAREGEKEMDLPEALKKVKNFPPPDPKRGEELVNGRKQIAAEAESHFQKGLASFQNRNSASARKEFLLTLFLNPYHPGALEYVKHKMAGEDSIAYEVKKGDTIKSVAGKIYNDPQKDFIIAYFNGLKIDTPLEPPMILTMPFFEPAAVKATSIPSKPTGSPIPSTISGKEILAKAHLNYDEANYGESTALAEQILQCDPANKESRELRNASLYQWGKQLSRQGKYHEALNAFRRVDLGYKDVSFHLAHNRRQLAEDHYKKGVKLFIEEEIERAILEWESTLALEPNHPRAKKDIENGRNVLQKLERVK